MSVDQISVEQGVSRILEGTVPKASDGIPENIELARVEVSILLEVSEAPLALCQEIERASARGALRKAFRQLNSFTRILVEADALGVHNAFVGFRSRCPYLPSCKRAVGDIAGIYYSGERRDRTVQENCGTGLNNFYP